MIFEIKDRLVTKFLGKIPLRIILIIPFVLTIFVTVVTVGYLSLKNGQESVEDVTIQFLNEVTARVERTLPSYLYIPNKINEVNALSIETGQLKLDNIANLEKHFWKQVNIFDTIAFIGVGLENKDNIGAERFNKDLITIRSSSKASNYIFSTFETNKKGEKVKFLHSIPFNPRKRPWYIAAVKARKPVWSEIYPNTAGITSYLGASMPFYHKNGKLHGVLITTVSLEQIGNFLKSLKIGQTGQVFITERNGLLVATSTGEKPFVKVKKDYGAVRIKASQTKDPLTRFTAKYIEEHAKEIGSSNAVYLETKINKEKQFVVVRPFRDKLGLDWLITVVVPEEDFMGKINENTKNTIMLSIIAMLISILIGIYLTRKITGPLLALSKEMHEIANFELDKNENFSSVFSEIEVIQSSLLAMKKGLRSFEKYVSSEIVRRLIKTKKEAHLGVEHADVTVFFSDVADFTTITESINLESLVEIMSEYLGEMTNIILTHEGTLDKYIGDAIMAFWNAPQEVGNHPKVACKTALECLEKLSLLRKDWQKRGLPPLTCRIGLHTGNVLVGNLGSKKRMDYTVIGDTVNLASRLEGLNKYYGTEIVISEELYRLIKDDFVCRPLDLVAVKGRSSHTLIYELMATIEKATDEQKYIARTYTEALWLYKSRNFSKAMSCLEEFSSNYPDDIAAKNLYSRCQTYNNTPPDKNWTGIITLREK